MLAPLLFIAAAIGAQGQPVVFEGEKPVEKRVCRTERERGTRMVKQVCRTATEPAKYDQDAKTKLGLGNRSTRPPDAFKAPVGN